MTRQYRALEFVFGLDVDDDVLAEYLPRLLDAFPVPTPGVASSLFRIEPSAGVEGTFKLLLDDVEVTTDQMRQAIVDALVLRLNATALAAPTWLTSHASAVAIDGRALVFPAHTESGKSTLAAGLVRAGFEYVSDEGVAFDWDTGIIEPYPKPLSLDPGSWPLFPELDTSAAFGADAHLLQWQVSPTWIGPGRVSGPCRAAALVFPHYEAGAETVLVPITRGEGLVEWAKNTFRFNEHGRRALDTLARITAEVDCYRMTVGDLDEAVALVAALAERIDAGVQP